MYLYETPNYMIKLFTEIHIYYKKNSGTIHLSKIIFGSWKDILECTFKEVTSFQAVPKRRYLSHLENSLAFVIL